MLKKEAGKGIEISEFFRCQTVFGINQEPGGGNVKSKINHLKID